MCYRDEQQIQAGNKFDEKVKDMPEFIKNYFVFLSSNNSKLSYWSTIRLFLEWLIENNIIQNTLDNITPDDLNRVTDIHVVKYFDGLLIGQYGEKVSPNTVERKKNNLSGFWAYLVDKEYVSKNIITKAVSKKYKVEDSQHEIEVPTDKQIEMVLSNLSNMKCEIIALRNIAIVKLFIGTGIRLSELVGLDVDDLHFDNENPEITIWGKGKKNSRDVLVSRAAIDAVNDYLKVRNTNTDLKDLKPLFLSERKDKETNLNKRVDVSTVEKFFKEYSNGEIRPHMLRHYFGTKAYKHNHNIVGVSKQLGHRDVKTTNRYYVESDDTDMMDALNSF